MQILKENIASNILLPHDMVSWLQEPKFITNKYIHIYIYIILVYMYII
jgi:hypothetical protein